MKLISLTKIEKEAADVGNTHDGHVKIMFP